MTKEELLKPRYKVIADYPNSPFKINEILEQEQSHENNYWCSGCLFTDRYPQNYPHLFKKLEWWENLPPKDKPDYLKGVDSGIIYKVYEWGGTNPFVKNYGELNIRAILPATEQEYNDYINQKK